MDVSDWSWFRPWLGMRAWSFVCAPHPTEASCGPTGLPLTPHSVGALGRAQMLVDDFGSDRRLVPVLDCVRGTHERIVLVELHDKRLNSLHDVLASKSPLRKDSLMVVATKVLETLKYLHHRGVIHSTLEPRHIQLNMENGDVRLAGFALGYVTGYGRGVDFPIFNPRFVAPEILSAGHRGSESSFEALTSEEASLSHSADGEERPRIPTKEQISAPDPKCDSWSLGVILACMGLGLAEPWPSVPVTQILRRVLGLRSYQGNILRKLFSDVDANLLDAIDPKMLQVINRCLVADPEQRAGVDELLKMLRESTISESNGIMSNYPSWSRFPSMALRCLRDSQSTKEEDSFTESSPLHLLTQKEIYHLWKLAGGNVLNELKKITAERRPSILGLPPIITKEGHFVGKAKERSSLFDPTSTQLSFEQLQSSLDDMSPVDCFPLVLTALDDEDDFSDLRPASENPSNLPLVIKEANVRYQFSRLILYRRLLRGYPDQSERIRREAKIDVVPLYRAQIWASLLGINHNTVKRYESIDKESWTPTDRQIDVDIPRCHQYNALLASPSGHSKLKRVLKAWVTAHPEYVYWQGLDSLCAPFLILNMNDEALAYACLCSFIPKYLRHMFLRNNAPVIQEYLAKFNHLQAFEEPELFNHLDSIGFIPELYAIPWILTMFAHVFPLHNIFHLWDQLLLGDNAFPLCIALAILQQLRQQLVKAEFNECILLFTDLPAIDIDKCIKDSRLIAKSTPKSITYRRHAYSKLSSKNELIVEDNNDNTLSSILLETLKSEKVPRMDPIELLQLIDSNKTNKENEDDDEISVNVKILDVRPLEEYRLGSLAGDVTHLPVHLADEMDDNRLLARISCQEDNLIVCCGSQSRESESVAFAHRLLRLAVKRVCLLHGGVDVYRRVRPRALVVPNL